MHIRLKGWTGHPVARTFVKYVFKGVFRVFAVNGKPVFQVKEGVASVMIEHESSSSESADSAEPTENEYEEEFLLLETPRETIINPS